jgi:hypothetical protein
MTGADDDPDREVWAALAHRRRAAERAESQRGTPPRAIRRMVVRHPSTPYPRVLFSLAVDTVAGSVLFYLPATLRTVHFRCARRHALATFLNADPADTGAGFTVTRNDSGDSFAVRREDVTVHIGRDQRAEVIAFLML